jgi:hypothetical protein
MKPGNSVDVLYSGTASAVLLTVQHGPTSVTVALDRADVAELCRLLVYADAVLLAADTPAAPT